MMQAVQDSVRRYVNDNPGLSQEEYAKVYASQLNIYRDKFSRALNEMAANGAILTPKVLKEQDDLFKGELDYVGDLVTGPTSSASTALREAARSDAEITITANDSMRLFAIFNKMGVPLTDEARSAVNAYLSTRANAGEHVNLIEQVGQSLSKYLSDPEMSMQGMRDDSAEALAIAGTLTLAGLGDRNPEAMQRFKEKPEGFLNMLEPAAFAWGREPNARKKEAIWRASTSDTLIEGVKGLDAGFQQRAYMSLKSMISERAQTVVAPRILEQEMDFSEARDAFVLKNPGNAQYSTRLEMLNQAYRKAKKLEESVGNPSDADIILNDYLGLSFRPTTPEVATP
jgi:hypothetical protein